MRVVGLDEIDQLPPRERAISAYIYIYREGWGGGCRGTLGQD